jgi:hypothetical protein
MAALLAAFGPLPAAADWLVLRDGSKVETQGPWQVKGRVVVFDLPSGQLTSLRLAEVDLAASDEATAAAVAAAAAPKPVAEPPAARKAKIVITDADIPRGDVSLTSPGGDADVGGQEGAPSTKVDSGDANLVVLSWERVESPGGDGLQIYGTLQNQGRQTVTNAGMRVLVYAADGVLIDRREAQLTRTELPVDARANFSVDFVGVFDFAAAKFEPHYRTFEPPRTPTGDVDADLRAPSG